MAEKLTEKTFQFELVSPEKVLASETAYMVIVPGEAGDFGVLADHAPLLSSLRPGVVTVTSPDMSERRVFVAGGFADVNDNTCAVLAEEAINVSELDRAQLERELSALREDLAAASREDVVNTTRLQRRIAVTEAKIAALQPVAA